MEIEQQSSSILFAFSTILLLPLLPLVARSLRSIKNYYTKAENNEIDIEGRKTAVDPEWNRYRLQENLQKICLSLTSIHDAVGDQQISVIDSLATCLIQHAANRYDGVSNLDEAWDSVVSSTETKEEDWIRFRVRLEKKRQEILPLPLNNYKDFKRVVDEVVRIFKEFQWFQLTTSRSIHFTLFADKWKVQLAEKCRDSPVVTECFIWYDKEAGSFNGIAKWSQTFADPQVYYPALMCQLDQSLRNFFRLLLSEGNPDEEKLKTRIDGYLDDLKNCGHKIEDHEALLIRWNCYDDGLMILIRELLNPNFVEDNRQCDIEKDLREEFIQNLDKSSEEIQIEHFESYEKARLELLEKAEEVERQRRQLIKAKEGKLSRVEQELRKAEQSDTMGTNEPIFQMSCSAMLISELRNKLQKKKDKLAWGRFVSLLGRSRPPYELARLRCDHKLLRVQYEQITGFAADVITEFDLKESFEQEGGDLSNLTSFIQRNTSVAKNEIIGLLKDMVKEPMQNATNQTWKFNGNALVLSQILDKVKSKMPLTCEEIHVVASRVIYIDCDWVTPGISLAISAPLVEVVGPKERTIDTSGSNAQQIEDKKARDGIGSGVSGDPGSNGAAGESAGHVSIVCDRLHGCKLKIKACGGNGADGQEGGDGTPGSDGRDGEDAKLRPPEEVNQNFSYIPLTLLKYFVPGWNLYEMSRSVLHYFQGSEFAIRYEEKGEEGESGSDGGSGGSGGSGGKGGFPGKIDIKYRLEKTAAIEEDAKNGADGKNGIPGKGAAGGKGGRNGWDAARVFTPNDLNPWFYISGDWKEDKGDLLIEDVYCKNKKRVLGCKITRRSQDKRVTADGQHGKDGDQSETSNVAVPKKAMSEVDAEWTMQEQESTAALNDLEQSIRADAAALASVEAQAFAENEKDARAAAEELEANEQKLDRASEIEQRTRKEFQKAKIAFPVQSMQSQLLNADQQLPDEPETMEEAEEPYPETVNTIQTIPITSNNEWDSLEGVSLLDALIDKFADDTEKSQTLSMLSQSLLLRIQQQDLWTEVTNIVRRHMDRVDDLIQSLKHINQNIELGQLFLLNKDMELLNGIQRAIQEKTLGSNLFNDANKNSVLVTIDYFQRLTWDYEELGGLLKSLESDSSVEKGASKVRGQLVEVLGNRLISVVASQLPGSPEKLLSDLFQCCRRNNPSIRFLFGSFFDNLMEALKKVAADDGQQGQDGDQSERSNAVVPKKTTLKTSDQMRTTLNEFIQEKLGVLHVKDLFPSNMKTISPEQLDKLAFLLNNVKTDVKDLDDVRSRVTTLSLEKKKTEEPFNQVLLLVETAFDQFYWSQECIKIQTMLAHISAKYQRQSTNAQRSKETAMEREFFLNSVERLKVALTWTYCRKSYQQKLDISSELRNRFRSTAWRDLVKRMLKKKREEKEGKKETEEKETEKRFDFEKTVRFFMSMDWIKKREMDIIGASKNQEEESDQSFFMDFVNQLVDQKKVDVGLINSMRPQLRRALHYLHQNKTVSFTAAEITTLNALFEKSRFGGGARDDSSSQDEADLRAEYLLNWKERYFLRWTDCHAEIDRVRKEIRSNWIEICADLDSVLEPTKVVQRMDVLLNRYNFLTSLCLSPAQCNKQWQSLIEEPHENLEQCIKTRMQQDFSHVVQQLTADVVTKINELSATSKPGKTNQTQPESEMYLLEALDSLVTVAVQCEGPEKEKRLSSLLPNVELLILCKVGLDDSDPTRTSNVVTQLEKWKESISRSMKLNGKLNETFKSLSKILDLVFWSVTGDELLIEELILKDRQNRQDVKRAIVSFESFLHHLVGANEIETLDIFKATVQFLKDGEDFNPWSLSFNQKQDQHLLVDKQIDIWNHRVKEKNLQPKKGVAAFMDALLTSSSHSMLKLRLTIAAQLLDHYIKPCEDLVLLEGWSGSIATISTWPEVQKDQDIFNRLLTVQTFLIRHLTAFLRRRLQQKKVKKSIEFKFKELINQLGVVANFLDQSEVQANLLIFDGLVLLVKAMDVNVDGLNPSLFVSQYIEQLYNGNKKGVKKNYDLRKKAICQVLYSDSKDQEKEPVFTPLEKSYVERWLQTKSCFQSEDHIQDFFCQIEAVNKSNQINQTEAVKTQENRLFSSTDFDIMFTSEEKNYIGIVGRDVAEELLRTQQPLSYMHVLKERAVQKIYLGFLRYFYPKLDTEQKDLLLNTKPIAPTDPNDKQKCIVEFRQAFSRAHFFAKRGGVEFEWLIWLQETVLRSIMSTRDQVGLALVTEILLTSIEFTPEQLFSWTTKSRPHRWLDDALVNSIMNVIDQFYRNPSATNIGSDQLNLLKTDLQSCLKTHQQNGRAVLKIFLRKLEHESRLNPIELPFLAGIVADLKVLQRIDDIERFRETPLRKWARLIQHARLADAWPSSLTDQLTTILDRRLGHDKTDRFLQRFHSKYGLSENTSSGSNPEKILQDMLKNLSKYPWIVDKFFTLANEENVFDDHLWKFIQSREQIEKEKITDSKADLDPKQLTDVMKNDEGSCAVVGSLQQKLIDQVKEIQQLALEKRSWDDKKIQEWTENQKKDSKTDRLKPVDFLSVAFQAVKLKEKYGLRDAQLLAVLIFISSSTEDGPQLRRRMAQISTGEGKTVITALLVVFHVLDNWSNGRRFVDIITSSSVLAEANVKEMKWFFDLFGIVVNNNCDAECSEDEKKRRLRYNSDVIYGDLSSFQRDILLSHFFSERKITNGRVASAVVVDEVDSMLLDKGENILYLSHKIPEMDHLTQVFVEIWNAVHAPDVALSDESAQAKVYRYMKLRLERGEIVIPKCLETYVHRHLLAWTRNAFRAKNLVTTKDSYKVDDVGDGHGQQIVIMDKETGVEQVQMHWSQGLHQFLQLKHTLKLSPVSLKAVFMSNIGFFEECKDDGRRTALYGMTGTLGSTAECQLLHDVFNVDFFKMPRHKRRFCIEEDPLLASSKEKWLENISNAAQTQLDKGRAVLIVCENIAAAEVIHNELLMKQSNDKKNSSKIDMYISSFDKEFQKKQHDSALGPGDVIVATNLAGRGTDLKINDELAENGGLHVVIGYVPANARVEAQIEGRVARAGQPGSFQFVVCHPSVNSKKEPISELLRLKVHRDDKEHRRLATIRNRGVQKINLEGKLFDRFHKEIYSEVKMKLAKRPDCKLQTEFLTNRWALWLDENAEHINNVHLKKSDEIDENFQKFKENCLKLCHHSTPLAFALTPSELMKLGDFYETCQETDLKISCQCYSKVIEDEPNACEAALIRQAKLILKEAIFDKKKEAKILLKRAKNLIKIKMELLTSTSELVKLTSKCNQRAGGAVPSQDRFEEQIISQLSLLQIHLSAVEDILGRPVRQMLEAQFPKDSRKEIRELLDVIEARADLCKPPRLSKNISFVSKDGNEMICLTSHQVEKTVTWPSRLDHCLTQTIQLLKQKIMRKSSAIEKKELESVILTQDQLWQALIQEGFVSQEEIIRQQKICWADPKMECVKTFLNDFPKELMYYKSLIVNWLENHKDEDYATAEVTLGLDSENSSILVEFLKTKKVLLFVDERHGKVSKTFDFKSDLPENLRKHHRLLSDWSLVDRETTAQIGKAVSREDLPCPKDSMEAVDQLWNFLVEQDVIKESKMIFSQGLKSEEIEIEKRIDEIKTAVNNSLSSSIDDICRKYRTAPEPVTELSRTDYQEYLEHDMSVTTESNRNPKIEHGIIKKWIAKRKMKKHLESYRDEVFETLKKSIGQLHTIPRVTASFQPLSKHFMSDPNPKRFPAEEIQSLQDKTFDQVIILKEDKLWRDYWSWRAFFVASFAFVKLSAGLVVHAISDGMINLDELKIPGSFGEMMFAIQNSLSGMCAPGAFSGHMLLSVGLTIATGGLTSYLSTGTAALKAVWSGFQGRTGLSSFFAAAKAAMVKYGKPVLSALTSFGVDKFLTWLKTYIMDKMTSLVKGAISKILSPMFDTLVKKLEQIRELMTKKGLQLAQIMASIRATLKKVGTSELTKLWVRRAVDQATSLANSMVGGFAKTLGDVSNALKTSFKFDGFVEKAKNVLKYLEKSAEVVRLASQAPEYVESINQTLDTTIIKKLESGIEIEVDTSSEQATEKTFDEFKEKVKNQIEDDIFQSLVESFKKAWFAPWLQSKIDGMVDHYSKKTLQVAGFVWQGSDSDDTAAEADDSADQGNTEDPPTAIAAGEEDAEKLKDLLGDDGCDIQKDRKGKAVVEPKTFEQVVDSIGGGEPVGLLQMQMIADAVNYSLEIVDKVGEIVKDGSECFHPEGKANGKIKVIFAENEEDDTKRVTVVGLDDQPIDLSPTVDASGKPAPLSGCIYDAVAKALGSSTFELLAQIKIHSTNSKTARYWYDEMVGDAFPGLKVGNRAKEESSTPDIYLRPNEESKISPPNGVYSVVQRLILDTIKEHLTLDAR